MQYASHSRRITTPRQHPTTQFFTGRMPFPPPNQKRQSAEGSYLTVQQQQQDRLTAFNPGQPG